MSAENIRDLLPDYVRGRLDQQKTKMVEVELERSESLRHRCEELRRYYDALDALEPARASDEFMDKLHARMDEPPLMQRLFRVMFLPLGIKLPIEIVGVAATALLVVLLYNPFSPQSTRRWAAESKPAIDRPAAEPGPRPDKEHTAADRDGAAEAPAVPAAKEEAEEPRPSGPTPSGKKTTAREREALSKASTHRELLGRIQGLQHARSDAQPAPAAKPGAPSGANESDPAPQTDELAGGMTGQPETAGNPAGSSRIASLFETKADFHAAPSEALQARGSASSGAGVSTDAAEPQPQMTAKLVLALAPTAAERKPAEQSYAAKRRARRSTGKAASTGMPAAESTDETMEKETPVSDFSRVEAAIRNHGGSFRVAESASSLRQGRTYVVRIPRGDAPSLIEDLKTIGVLEGDRSFPRTGSTSVEFELRVVLP